LIAGRWLLTHNSPDFLRAIPLVGASLLAACADQPMDILSRLRSNKPQRRAIRASYGGDRLDFGDLWLPDRLGPHPVAIVVHGGFWFNTYDLELMTPMSNAFADAGIAAWNIEYRRIGDYGGGWPGTLLDNALATEYVSILASEHNLDLKRVITIGHSAGGHLALWLAARGKIPSGDMLFTGKPLPLRAAISLAGVADLRRGWEMGLGGGAVERLIGGSHEEMVARFATASPAELLPLGVKQILMHGTADDRVPYEMSQGYQALAAASGDDASLITLPTAGHFEVIDPTSSEFAIVLQAVKRALA
jgi:acetyl esterase/lipase